MAGIGQDLKKIHSDETRIVENASLCTGEWWHTALLLAHPVLGSQLAQVQVVKCRRKVLKRKLKIKHP